MSTEKKFERGATYSAKFTGHDYNAEKKTLLLVFETNDGMEHVFYKDLTDENQFKGAVAAMKALGQKKAFPVVAPKGTEVSVVLSAKDEKYVQFVNTPRRYTGREMENADILKYNAIVADIGF